MCSQDWSLTGSFPFYISKKENKTMGKLFNVLGYIMFSALMLFFEDRLTRYTVEEVLVEKGLIK